MRNFSKRLNSLVLYLLISVSLFPFNSYSQKFILTKYNLPVNTSIRAIAVENDSTVWFGGSRGIFGYTQNAGISWHIDSVKYDSVAAEFRSIAVLNDSTVLLINVGSPARVLKTTDKGKTWRIVYFNDDKNIFFDSMKFLNESIGYALADPIDGCFTFLKTKDGGETWTPIDCFRLLKVFDGEACFASSNSSIEVVNHKVWFATGGTHARIFSSVDYGTTWQMHETPMVQGEQMTGIYSIAFYDEEKGIIVGGNYDKKNLAEKSKAITKDGGNTWKLLEDKSFGFGSCVKYLPASKGKKILIASLPGIYFSKNKGKSFTKIADESFYTFQISPSGKVAWFAGNKGAFGRMEISK